MSQNRMPPRPERTYMVEITVVVSGHKRVAKQAKAALEGLGFVEIHEYDGPAGGPCSCGKPERKGVHKTHSGDWGLPSYTDPIAAHAAGKPNAGHTPGTPHPTMLRHLVLDDDHEPGCTRLSPEEWIERNPKWKPKVTKVTIGEDDDGKPIHIEHTESIDPEDPRLFLPCEHLGTTEWRGHECIHGGTEYERDDRIGFIGATIEVPEGPLGMHDAASSAMQAVEPLGWALRLHWEVMPEAPKPTLADRLEFLGIDRDELREFLKGE